MYREQENSHLEWPVHPVGVTYQVLPIPSHSEPKLLGDAGESPSCGPSVDVATRKVATDGPLVASEGQTPKYCPLLGKSSPPGKFPDSGGPPLRKCHWGPLT